MSDYLTPDVYIESIPASKPALIGVGTTTASFIGVAHNVVMPPKPGEFLQDESGDFVLNSDGQPTPILYELVEANRPQWVSSWDGFQTLFGDIQMGNEILALAVYGFFRNGGEHCWVMRVEGDRLPDNLAPTLKPFEVLDDIALVAVPGATTTQQHQAMIAHCSLLKDRVAILDAPSNFLQLSVQVEMLPAREVNSYAAMYYPWISTTHTNGQTILVPPSGHIAGVFARNDVLQGVYEAPANEVIIGAFELGETLSLQQQSFMHRYGVNVLRSLNGQIKVWGARTLRAEANQPFQYISSRRYYNYLRESIERYTQFIVFEPNAPALWQQVRRSINRFLYDEWQSGGLYGDQARDAYFVKCDAETNPPESRALGQLVIEIGVAIVQPTEFVVFRVQQQTNA